MLIYAHRGSSLAAPENTIAAFKKAVEDGADGIELDIQSSQDRVPVVIHDNALKRTTGSPGKASDLPLEALQKLDAGNGEHIPSLAEVLKVVPESVHLDIEVKCKGIEPEILTDLHDRPKSSWAISSFDWSVLETFRSLDSEAELWLLMSVVTDQAITTAQSLGATALAVHNDGINATIARIASEAGLKLVSWTVNDPAEARRVRELGVAGMCTDTPAEIIAGLVAIDAANDPEGKDS
ncbi:MAG: glycerophosphodiester phosphodiesterase [Thermomicrobiales bacterium]